MPRFPLGKYAQRRSVSLRQNEVSYRSYYVVEKLELPLHFWTLPGGAKKAEAHFHCILVGRHTTLLIRGYSVRAARNCLAGTNGRVIGAKWEGARRRKRMEWKSLLHSTSSTSTSDLAFIVRSPFKNSVWFPLPGGICSRATALASFIERVVLLNILLAFNPT